MLSFKLFQIYRYSFLPCVNRVADYMILYEFNQHNEYFYRWLKCGAEGVETEIFNRSVNLYVKSSQIYPKFSRNLASGFHIRYSFHDKNTSVKQLNPGSFDCSQHYQDFHGHLGCNVRKECIGGEDETSTCPYFNSRCKPESLYLDVRLIFMHWLLYIAKR